MQSDFHWCQKDLFFQAWQSLWHTRLEMWKLCLAFEWRSLIGSCLSFQITENFEWTCPVIGGSVLLKWWLFTSWHRESTALLVQWCHSVKSAFLWVWSQPVQGVCFSIAKCALCMKCAPLYEILHLFFHHLNRVGFR